MTSATRAMGCLVERRLKNASKIRKVSGWDASLVSLEAREAASGDIPVFLTHNWVIRHLVIDGDLLLLRELNASEICFSVITPGASGPIFGIAASFIGCILRRINIKGRTRTCELNVVAAYVLISRAAACSTEKGHDEQKTACGADSTPG